MSKRWLLAVATVGLFAAAIAVGHQDEAVRPAKRLPLTTVTCGQLISRSIRVNNDLSCSSSNGLNVARDKITIDMNHHTFFGTSSWYGINLALFPRVTVTNGTVQGWLIGVAANANGERITRMAVDGGSTGISIGSAGNAVSGNTVVGSTVNGIDVAGNDHRITGNTVRGAHAAGIFVGGRGTLIQGNVTTGNDDIGIDDGGVSNRLIENVAYANGTSGSGPAIYAVTDDSASIGHNVANENRGYGIDSSPLVHDLGGNRAHGNTTVAQCHFVVCS